MMGLSKLMVGVVGENGRPDWSMKMVNGGDVGCRSSELLSWLFVGCIILFWNFSIFLWVLVDG